MKTAAVLERELPARRIGLLDLATGEVERWSPVKPRRDINSRDDFAFSRDGQRVFSRLVGPRDGMQQFYDLAGNEVAAPAKERHLRRDVDARLSPDGRIAAVGLKTEGIIEVRGAQLLAWVDNKRLIAWERTAGSELHRPRLALVSVDSDKVEWLSGPREQNVTLDRAEWEPVFARR